MNHNEFMNWLKAWMSRHPSRGPSDAGQASYAQEVMQRIREKPAPAPAPVLRWLPAPRLALSFGAAAACLVVWVMLGSRPSTETLARDVSHDLDMLVEMDEAVDLPLSEWEDDLEALDVFILAEAAQTQDETPWLMQMMDLIEELDEETGLEGDDGTLEEWLEEIEFLDDSEIASS